MRSNSQLAAIGALVLLVAAAPSQAKVSLSFGLYTSNKPTAMVKQFRPVLDAVERAMEADLGEPVDIRIQVAKNYSQGIEHLASGKVDFSRFGPASYVEAKRANSGLRILAMEREGAEKVFYGVIAVAQDSPSRTVEDLRGRSFAFGSDQSTIGRYLSQQYLRKHGIYADDLSRYDYLSRHDKVGTAVGAGHFEAGALNETTFNALVERGVPIRELARFPNVTKPWIAREGLPERLFAALRDALMRLDEPAALAALEKDGFLEGDDSDYEEIRASIEHNSAFFEKPADLVAMEVAPGPATAPPDAETVARAATAEAVGEGNVGAEHAAVAGAAAHSSNGEAQVTEAQVTEAQVTEAQVTEAQATEAQATEAQATEAQVTEAQVTEAQVTDAQVTEAQVTEAQATEAQATEAQVNEAAVTEGQASEVQVTEAQVVEAQVIEGQVTEAQVVEAPVIEAPVIEAQVIEAHPTGGAGDTGAGFESIGTDTVTDPAPVLASPAAGTMPGTDEADRPAAPEPEPSAAAPRAAPPESPVVDGEPWSEPEPRTEPSATIDKPSRPAG